MQIPEQWKKDWMNLMQPGQADDFFDLDELPPFSPVTDKFDIGVALWTSEFCRLIYRQEADEGDAHAQLRQRSKILIERGKGWREVEFFNGLKRDESRKRRLWRPALPVEDTQAAILHHEEKKCTVVVFRGTLGLLDLLTDAAFLAWPLRFKLKGAAHHGFRDALETVWEKIRAQLLKLEGKVFLTGHSLGGALATLAACRMLNDDELKGRVAALYTFGSPRVGTEGFEQNFEKDGKTLFHARVVNGDDLVAQVPPAFSIWPFPRYCHVGTRFGIKEGGQIEQGKNVNEDAENGRAGVMETRKMLLGMIRGVERETLGAPTKPLKDHTPLLYTHGLAEVARAMKASGAAELAGVSAE